MIMAPMWMAEDGGILDRFMRKREVNYHVRAKN